MIVFGVATAVTTGTPGSNTPNSLAPMASGGVYFTDSMAGELKYVTGTGHINFLHGNIVSPQTIVYLHSATTCFVGLGDGTIMKFPNSCMGFGVVFDNFGPSVTAMALDANGDLYVAGGPTQSSSIVLYKNAASNQKSVVATGFTTPTGLAVLCV